MLTLAETSLPDPNSYTSIGWLLIALAGLFVAVNQVLKFVDRFKANPPLHKEYTTRQAHDELSERFDDFRDVVSKALTDAASVSRASREKIYIELRGQAAELAKNTEKTALTHAHVIRLDEKFDRMLERLAKWTS